MVEENPSISREDHKSMLIVLKKIRRSEWHSPSVFGNIITMMLKKEGTPTIEELGRAPLPTEFGDWTYIVFGDLAHGKEHEMLVFGNLSESIPSKEADDVLVRVHSSCHTGEIFRAVNCECREQLHTAMKLIQQEGKGVIVYLDQEGRGNGIVGKLTQLNKMFEWQKHGIGQKTDPKTGEALDTDKAYKESGYPSETRDFSLAGEMLKSVGVRSIRLLTNNPKKIKGIEDVGIKVKPVEIHIAPANEIIAVDLRSKAKNLGHKISEKHWKTKKPQ